MTTFEVKMNSKGQITIPAQLRRQWNLKRGDKLEFYFDHMGMLRVRPRNLPPSAVWENAPTRPTPRGSMTDDDAIAAAIAEKDRRSRSRKP